MLVVAASLVLSIGLVRGLTFSIPNSIPQCSRFTVNWANAEGSSLTPFQPFNVSVLPFDAVPFSLNVPSTAWQSNTSGSFEATVPIAGGGSFLLSTGGEGDAGGTSNIIAVAPSDDSGCLRQGPPPSTFSFATSPINCNPSFLNISFFSSDGSTPTVRAFVPRGPGPSTIQPQQQNGKTLFSVTVGGETQLLLDFQGPNDLTGTSRLITVGGSQATSNCLQTLIFAPPNNLTLSNSAAQTDSPVIRNQSGKIIGIVVGSVLGTFAIAWAAFLIKERYRGRDKAGRKRIRDSEFGMVTGLSVPTEKVPPLPAAVLSEKQQRERESKLFPYNNSALQGTLPPPATAKPKSKGKKTTLARLGLVRKSMIGRPTNLPPDVFDQEPTQPPDAPTNIGAGPNPRDIGRVV